MKLHFNPGSPFVRMTMVTAHELGLDREIELVPTGMITPFEVHPAVAADSPLGKIPTLVTEDGQAIYDSRVICSYLAGRAGNTSLQPEGLDATTRMATLQALCQGICDAAVALRYETAMRPEELRWDEFAERQKSRIIAGLDDLEANWLGDLHEVSAGSIAAAVALSYLDFRLPDLGWRNGRSGLAGFYEDFSKRPSMAATEPANPT